MTTFFHVNLFLFHSGKKNVNGNGRTKKVIAVKETNQNVNVKEIEIARGDVTEVIAAIVGIEVIVVTELIVGNQGNDETEEIEETASARGEVKMKSERRILNGIATGIASVTVVDDVTETVVSGASGIVIAAGESRETGIEKGGSGIIRIGTGIAIEEKDDGIATETDPRRREAGMKGAGTGKRGAGTEMRGEMKTGRGSLRVKG